MEKGRRMSGMVGGRDGGGERKQGNGQAMKSDQTRMVQRRGEKR